MVIKRKNPLPLKPIEVKTISTFNDYLKVIKEVEGNLITSNNDDFVIYRGQSVDKNLYPKIGRIEYKLPKRKVYESKIISDFKRLSYPHLNVSNAFNDWDILAIAQHHFLPTRLLDWSGNPLIALWFAVFNMPSDMPKRVVWCYSFKQSEIVDSNTGNPFSQTRTLVYQPRHISNRIVSQNGWFTSHYYNEENNGYTALNLKRGTEKKLVKFILNINEEDEKKTFLADLDTYGINSYSIFSDLEGLCQYLDWKTFKR